MNIRIEPSRRDMLKGGGALIVSFTLAPQALAQGAPAVKPVALTEVARHSASDRDQGAVQVAGVLAGLLLLGATERADLRCWAFLPGEARVGTLDLPTGEHEIRVVYKSASGGELYAGPWRRVAVPPDGLATVVEHYWK